MLIQLLGVQPAGSRVLCIAQPVVGNRPEFVDCHVRVRRHDEFEQGMFAARYYRVDVIFQNGLERLRVFPLWVFRCKCLDAIEIDLIDTV